MSWYIATISAAPCYLCCIVLAAGLVGSSRNLLLSVITLWLKYTGIIEEAQVLEGL